jgi:hypothetical protein
MTFFSKPYSRTISGAHPAPYLIYTRGWIRWGVNLMTRLHILTSLRIRRSVPPFSHTSPLCHSSLNEMDHFTLSAFTSVRDANDGTGLRCAVTTSHSARARGRTSSSSDCTSLPIPSGQPMGPVSKPVSGTGSIATYANTKLITAWKGYRSYSSEHFKPPH